MDNKSPEINSDPDDFQSLEEYERSPETSRSIEMEEIGNLEVNPPRPGDHSPSYDEDDVNLENFRVEFGGGAQDEPETNSPTLISDVDDNNEENDEDIEETSNLYLSVGHEDNEQEGVLDEEEEEEPMIDTVEDEIVEPSDDPNLENQKIQDEEDYEEVVDENEPSISSVPFHTGSLGPENVLDTKDVEVDDFTLEPDNKTKQNEEQEDVDNTIQDEDIEFFDRSGRKVAERSREIGENVDRVQEFNRKDIEENLTSRSTDRKRGRPKFGNEDINKQQSDPIHEIDDKIKDNSSNRNDKDKQKTSKDKENNDINISSNVIIKSKKYMTPGAVIYNYEKGRISRREAFEILQEVKRSKMLHKSTDKVYIDKEGDIRIPRGYSFGKSRTSEGKIKRKRGLTRIDREIQAYQKSTHMLIPRAIFARIVREIAQGWFKGEGQIKFTVEALAALQTAAEDEMIRLLETSMVCSRHAKRITLRVEDVRLARFCRGRQLYEFNNMDL